MLSKLSRLNLLLSFFTLSICNVNAQDVQLLLDPVSTVQKHSIFSLSLVNQSNFSGQVALTATLQSRGGKPLLKQEALVEVRANEMTSVRGSEVQPQTLYIDPEFEALFNQSIGFPPLNYALCVEANYIGDRRGVAKECIEYRVSDFINLIPIYPTEGAKLYEQRPLFTWMDASPQSGYTYDFKLVQLEIGQNPNGALRRNLPVVFNTNVQGNQLMYPADAARLQNNQKYAWNVTLNYQGEKVATSDSWEFSYQEEDSLIEVPQNLSYVDITKTKSGTELYAVGKFKFKYSSNVNTVLKAKLYDLNKKEKQEKELEVNSFKVNTGLNKFDLDLKDQAYLRHLKDYQLIITDEKSKKIYSLQIKYVNPDYVK
ncbi:MAG: hypothetical protein RIC95_03170 [Vicingaceae bacterium]